MAELIENLTICGLPYWVPIPNNETVTFENDVVLCAVSVPFCIFAFLANLAVILAVIKTPSLQRPSNILLCSLATTDCLTGLVAQPLFVAWRLMIHRIHESCDHQGELFKAYMVAQTAFAGWSLANLTAMSFDRQLAVSKPLVYRAETTKKVTGETSFSTGALQVAVITGTAWLVLTVVSQFILSPMVEYVVTTAVAVVFIIIPIANHVRIIIAIRHHNRGVHDAVSRQNLSAIFKRERNAAIDMFIIVAVLMLFLAPAIVTIVFGELLAEKFGVSYLWSTALLYINSSINPVLYLARSSELKNAVKFTIRKFS